MELQLKLPGDWSVGGHRPALTEEPDGDNLEAVLTWLREVEIDAWIQTTPPTQIAGGIHDPYRGRVRKDFHSSNGQWPRGEIARWLFDAGRHQYGHPL